MFYNTIRSYSKDAGRMASTMNSSSRSMDTRERLVNMQKRDKLKSLLITKFMKKYGIKNPEKLLHDEISKFLEGEKLTDADLKSLDEKLRKLLAEKEKNETLRKNLTETNTQVLNETKLVLPDLNKQETLSVHSKHSKMSGASQLSKYNDKKTLTEELEELESLSNKKPLCRYDFSNEGDEWNAICLLNQKMFEEEKKLNKLKDIDIKRRTKDDLDNQIRQKLKRLNEEHMKNIEYDRILLNHNDYLNELEKHKHHEMKSKILKEKENRDKQLKDEKTRKKIEILKEKKYEKELGKYIIERYINLIF
jgi:hypothetical protein